MVGRDRSWGRGIVRMGQCPPLPVGPDPGAMRGCSACSRTPLYAGSLQVGSSTPNQAGAPKVREVPLLSVPSPRQYLRRCPQSKNTLPADAAIRARGLGRGSVGGCVGGLPPVDVRPLVGTDEPREVVPP